MVIRVKLKLLVNYNVMGYHENGVDMPTFGMREHVENGVMETYLHFKSYVHILFKMKDILSFYKLVLRRK